MASPAPSWVIELAGSVFEQAERALPPGVTMHAEEGAPWRLHLRAEEPGEAVFDFGLLADQPGVLTRVDGAASALLMFLHFLQDFLARHTKAPWPGASGAMPMPGVDVVGDRIHGWFGDERSREAFPRLTVDVS